MSSNAWDNLESIKEKIKFYDSHLYAQVIKKIELNQKINALNESNPEQLALLSESLREAEEYINAFSREVIDAIGDLKAIFDRNKNTDILCHLQKLLSWVIERDERFTLTIFKYLKSISTSPEFWHDKLKPLYQDGYPKSSTLTALVLQLREVGFNNKDVFLILYGFYYDGDPVRYHNEVTSGRAVEHHLNFCRQLFAVAEDDNSINKDELIKIIESLFNFADTKNKRILTALAETDKFASAKEKIQIFNLAMFDFNYAPYSQANPLLLLAGNAKKPVLGKVADIVHEIKAVI